MLALLRQPDDKEYGVQPFWGTYELAGDRVVLTDGTPPSIEAPTEVDEFLAEFMKAAAQRRALEFDEWSEPYADLPANATQ